MRHGHLVLLALLLVSNVVGAETAARTLDDFSQPNRWTAAATDDIRATLHPASAPHGKAICLEFNFNGVSGGPSLRRRLPITFPENYALSFDVRGTMPPNDLQVKLIDASGDNVWWYRREHFTPTDAWQTITANKRDIVSAWGPAKDRTLRQTQTVEFTLYAGQGGRGDFCVSNLRLTPLPPAAVDEPTPASLTPNAVLMQQARHAARGIYPRGFSGEQSYWTLVGVDGGAAKSALISEDGAVEVRKGGWSIEPMLLDGNQLIDWATVQTRQSLQDNYLPIPTVHWQTDGVQLDTTAFASGTPQQTNLLLQYRLSNRRNKPRTLTLALLLRPFQVNPPTQFLNTPGGISPITDLRWDGHAVQINHALQVVSLQPGDFVASAHGAITLPERLAAGERPQLRTLHDASGYAQGALLYRLTVPPHATITLGLVVPSSPASFKPPADAAAWLKQQRDEVAAAWRVKLNHVTLALPAAQQDLADTARSAQAQMLMSRDGPAFQPGTRSYARTWIRDGAMMSEALLRSGHSDVVGAFVRWYAPHQFNTGKVPCCVDARGSDPVPENDSQGELLFTIAEWWRFSHDLSGLKKLWPHVEHTVAYMDQLRNSERTSAQQGTALYGLMPASISHEGYSAKPMHSYWDDFWALRGYDDAIALANALDKPDEAARFTASRDVLRSDLQSSILAATREHAIYYVPGAAELGDFDPTSTTIALSPAGAQEWLPPALLQQTFERYWQDFIARRDGSKAWDDYTPYEWRNVGAFVRLGWRERIPQLLAFFMADRRPAAWNQWAEVVGHDPRKPRFVGDMPHAWIASDYLRSLYDMFAWERASDHALVLAAGIPAAWLRQGHIDIEGLRTPYGELHYSLREQHDQLQLEVSDGLSLPSGGLVFPWPYAAQPSGKAWLNGKPVAWRNGEITIRELPATLRIERPR
ncbi:discoidin domain-containing protein [Rhodanobacter sp. AS-Z3]|uniref:discoidin domain-containing protein n=1 Tax=Rhodanobacter sp. AS-Z3 TaxID=3031330 RepID=UPI00247AD819|nr:discoidin domain-containing protein [Rhodanobacter sp. AS-Z3]WEN15485.1 discoidin domain-containing protein [Rhodanobacter sp. AS-Z3]